ncbi:hypothetical protein ACS0TY_014866 [Phlomoides rotata]
MSHKRTRPTDLTRNSWWCVRKPHWGLSFALKTIRQGYYWPSLRKDAITIARACHKCQIFASNIICPPHELVSVYSLWWIDFRK